MTDSNVARARPAGTPTATSGSLADDDALMLAALLETRALRHGGDALLTDAATLLRRLAPSPTADPSSERPPRPAQSAAAARVGGGVGVEDGTTTREVPTDTARLDWLDGQARRARNGVAVQSVGATDLALWEPLDDAIPDGWCLSRSAPSLRAAIDEAMHDAERRP